MIDITIYQQRLEWLKEWIEYIIYKNHVPSDVMNMYDNTGMLLYSWISPDLYHSFDAFCKYKQSLITNKQL